MSAPNAKKHRKSPMVAINPYILIHEFSLKPLDKMIRFGFIFHHAWAQDYQMIEHFACIRALSLLTAFFPLLSPCVTFLPEGVIIGFGIWHGVLSHTKKNYWCKTKFGGPPLPPWGVNCLGFFFRQKQNGPRIA